MIHRKTKLLSILLVSLLFLGGCSNSSGNPGSFTQFLADAKRKITPRFMRAQIFSNTPTAWNQTIDENRMGLNKQNPNTIRYKDVRTKENKHLKGHITEDSYGRGFQDGCRTFTGILGAGAYRLIKPVYNGNRMLEDQWYLRGFRDGSTFCTHRLDWEIH